MKKINQVLYQVGARYIEPARYPMIKIANSYLKKAGFNYGDKIEVEYQKGEIHIKKIEAAEIKEKKDWRDELEKEIKNKNRNLERKIY